MKVAFYSTSAEDLFRYRLPVARKLRDAGYTVVFVGPGGAYADQVDGEGFSYRRVPASLKAGGALHDMAVGLRLAGVYRDERPDIVHHFTLPGLVRGALAARMAHVDWVVQSLPPLLPRTQSSRLLRGGGRPVMRFALRAAEVTFRTHEDRQVLVSKGLVRPEQTHIIASSGIELDAYPFLEEPDRTPVAAMIGPLHSESTIETFAETARRLHTDGVAARFVLVSTQAHAPAVARSRLNEWIEDGLVEWWGRRRDAESILGKVHVVCAIDGHGRDVPHLMLEAAARGRPVVAPDTYASRSLVRDGDTGRLFAPDDKGSLADALGELLRDGERRRCMGRNARRLVESEFSADRVARQTLAVYERLFVRGRGV